MDPLKMYFLLKMAIFQPAMLVYQRVPKMEESSPKYIGCMDTAYEGMFTPSNSLIRYSTSILGTLKVLVKERDLELKIP